MSAAAPAIQPLLLLDFDWAGLPDHANLTVMEVARWMRKSRDEIYLLVTAGELDAHRKDVPRSQMTITRRSVMVYHVRTAQSEPGEILRHLGQICRRLSPGQRRRLAAALLGEEADFATVPHDPVARRRLAQTLRENPSPNS